MAMEKIRGDLSGVSLRYRDLSNLDLSEAEGVTAWSLAGSNLQGSLLPKNLEFDLVRRVENSIKACKGSLYLVLSAAFVCWLARLTTTDAEMAGGLTGPNLPLVHEEVDIKYFYGLAPLLILGIYIYFHLNLQILWSAIVNLPVVFPDGLRIDKKIYPWALIRLTELLTRDFWRETSFASRFRISLIGVLFWLAIPTSVGAYWLHYLNQHDRWLSSWHILVTLAVLVADAFFARRLIGLWIHSRNEDDKKTSALGGELDPLPPTTSNLKDLRKSWFRRFIGLAVAAGLAMASYSVAVIGFGYHKPKKWAVLNLEFSTIKADLRGADLKGAILNGADLSGSKMSGAKLDNAECDGGTSFPAGLTNKDTEGWSKSCSARALNP